MFTLLYLYSYISTMQILKLNFELVRQVRNQRLQTLKPFFLLNFLKKQTTEVRWKEDPKE